MSYINYYITEFRLRILYLLFSLFLTFSITYYYIENCLYFFSYPILKTNLLLILNLDIELILHRLIYTSITEAFIINIKFALIFSLLINFFLLIYHFLLFLLPSFYEFERKNFINFIIIILSCTIIGYLLNYLILIPNIWFFLLSFETETMNTLLDIKMEAKMDEYFDFVFTSFFYITLMFQLPSIIIVLKINNIINSQTLIKYRKYLIILSLFIGAILSPPDIFSQILFAIPIFFLYEFSVFILILIKYYF